MSDEMYVNVEVMKQWSNAMRVKDTDNDRYFDVGPVKHHKRCQIGTRCSVVDSLQRRCSVFGADFYSASCYHHSSGKLQ
ncbi:hypothetical protein LDENG_00060740 [Lucifuga dentata]|nr:hypothetical protein LDENG_00060740 [Lucifuga dentata]